MRVKIKFGKWGGGGFNIRGSPDVDLDRRREGTLGLPCTIITSIPPHVKVMSFHLIVSAQVRSLIDAWVT